MLDLSVLKPNGKFVFYEADYSSGEPICLAEITQCKAWQFIFDQGYDLYKVIANDVYELGIDIYGPKDEVMKQLDESISKAMRSITKISCLAIMYDESTRAFAYRSGITLEQAEHFYKQFYIKYPEILAYKKMIRGIVQRGGIIESLAGRRRSTYIPKTGDWKQDNKNFNSMVRRGINFPTQSLLADIMCIKAYEFVKYILDHDLQEYMQLVITIHDAAYFIVREELLPQLVVLLKSMMEDMSTLPFKFGSPLKTSCKIGYNWAEMIEEYKTNKEGKEVGWWALHGTN